MSRQNHCPGKMCIKRKQESVFYRRIFFKLREKKCDYQPEFPNGHSYYFLARPINGNESSKGRTEVHTSLSNLLNPCSPRGKTNANEKVMTLNLANKNSTNAKHYSRVSFYNNSEMI